MSPFPNVIESEPNDEAATSGQAVATIPVALNGILQSPGDHDHFRFRAQRGERLRFDVFASSVGSPVDSVIRVLDASGRTLATNDDDHSHDSGLTLQVPATGEYVLQIRDKRLSGGPQFIYRAEVVRWQPRLTLFQHSPLRREQAGQAIAVPRGGRVLAYLGVQRDGVEGPVRLACTNLPPGVHATVEPVPPDAYAAPVVFSADADAPLGATLAVLEGVAEDAPDVHASFIQNVPLIPATGDATFHSVMLDRLAVAVCDPLPLSVDIAAPAGKLPIDGEMEVEVRLTRSADMNGPVAVSFPVLPPGVEAPASIVVPAGESRAIVSLVVHPFATPGRSTLVAQAGQARASRGSRDPLVVGMNGLGGSSAPVPTSGVLVSSTLVPLTVAEPAVRGRIAPAAARQGQSIPLVCRFDSPPAACFTARLDGLPPRATAEVVPLAAGKTEVEFNVVVDATTPLGEFQSLICELAGSQDGKKVLYRVGRPGTLRVVSADSEAIDVNNKPVSPLDALRRRQSAGGGTGK